MILYITDCSQYTVKPRTPLKKDIFLPTTALAYNLTREKKHHQFIGVEVPLHMYNTMQVCPVHSLVRGFQRTMMYLKQLAQPTN